MFALNSTLRLGFLSTLLLVSSMAEEFDTTPAWPLCGRISEAIPSGWSPNDGCPSSRWGNADYTDAPFSSTFGPRQKASESYRYDFHRGIDIPTPSGTAMFAIAKGIVKKAGSDPAYSDNLIQLRHYRPGYWGSCYRGKGCYISNYIHVSQWVVSVGETVEKGQLIGYSGVSVSGFAHLHFEIRNAPGKHDAYSTWQRDAIHPLSVLPYHDTQTNNMSVSIDEVNLTNPLLPIVKVTASLDNTEELDLGKIAVKLYEKDANGNLSEIVQTGNTPIGLTPEGIGYAKYPSWYDMGVFNRQYSYKNSSKFPWSVFEGGGKYESPFFALLPSAYNANVHMDNAMSSDSKIGEFNGEYIAPSQFNTTSSNYTLSVTFTKLNGLDDASALCIQAMAYDIKGNMTTPVSVNCD